MIRHLALASTCLALALAASAARAGALEFPGSERPGTTNPAVEALRDYTAVIHTNVGDMTLAFYPDAAPNTVRNFLKLAAAGFCDGQRFYSVFKGRMILAGDPTGTGTGDNGTTLAFEVSPIEPEAGTLAMDRKAGTKPGERESSGSRFLICLADQSHLRGDYTVFARISEGLDVARKIGNLPAEPNDGRPRPVEDAVIEQITVTRKPKETPKPEKID